MIGYTSSSNKIMGNTLGEKGKMTNETQQTNKKIHQELLMLMIILFPEGSM